MGPLVVTAILAFFAGQAFSQEMCAVNQCNNGENCYNRDSTEGYVCECNMPFRAGYDCSIGPDNQEVFTCYGSSCISGTFTSDDYPNDYPNRYRALYLLYIPGANGIRFTFNTPFEVETDKDELYIGKGLDVNFDLLLGMETVGPDTLFFEGFEVPAAATIMGTDTAWLYFITDKNIQYSGFSVVFQMVDNEPPSISGCPEDISVTTETPSGIEVSWTEPTATDASQFTRTSTHTPPAVFQEGSTDVTYTFVDEKGNAATCSFTVTVTLVDVERPQIQTTSEDITVLVPFGSLGTNVNWVEPTATDNFGTVFTSRSNVPGEFFSTGTTTTITYSFSDLAGNVAQTSFNVQVVEDADRTPPVLTTFPSDITVTVPFGTESAQVTWDEPTATDNSGTVFQNSNFPSGTNFPVGATTVTYTITDPTGNTVQQSFTVNVIMLVDNTPPVVTTFPSDVTVTVPFGTNSAPVTWNEPTSTDNSGTVSQTSNLPSGTNFPVGATPVTYTFSDPQGNSVQRSFTVNVVMLADSTPPQIITFPSDVTVTVPFGTDSAPVTWTEPSATDNSGTVFQNSNFPSGTTFPVGTTEVTYTVTDPTGNTVQRTFRVTVVMLADSTPPEIVTFPSDITVTVPFGTNSAPVTWNEPSATDNSGTVFQNSNFPSGTTFPVGMTEVTYTVTDPAGNTVQRTFRVSVVMLADSTPPEIITFPSDITVTVPFGTDSTQVTWDEPSSTDNSGTVFQNSNLASGTTFPVGTTDVTYTVTDPAGNTVQRTFRVSVVMLADSTPPVINTFPSDITVTVPFGTTSAPVSWNEPTSTDNSGSVSQTSNRPSGTNFPVGTTQVTYTVTDPTGNTVQRSFNVNVVMLADSTPPVVNTFPSDITVTVPFGTNSSPVTWNEPTSTDNSGSVSQTSNLPSGTNFPVGTTPVTYTFMDPEGNSVQRTFTVNVVMMADRTPPAVTSFPSDITVTVPFGTTSSPVTWTEPTSTDNSGTSIQSASKASGTDFPLGTTPVTYTFTDPAGNSVTQSFSVNVIMLADSIAPVINTFPSDITVTVPFGTSSTPVTWSEPTSTDNSGTSIQNPSKASGTNFPVGTSQVTYTFTDPTGNTVQRSFNVNVIMLDDTIPPIVNTFPSDITVTVPFGTTSTPVTWSEPTSSDNSGSVSQSPDIVSGSDFPVGTTKVTYTFVDPAGNSVTQDFDVNVIMLSDNSPPSVNTFPSDITVTVPFGTTSTPVTWQEPTSTDNSGTSIQSPSIPSGSDFPVGSTPVTYSFTDPTGNVVTQTFNVNVIMLSDTEPPQVISFPEEVTVTVPFGTTSTPVNWQTPTSSDNSGTVNTVSNRLPGSSFPPGSNTVTYTFTDPAGNFVSRSFDVNVVVLPDSSVPVVNTFPSDITVTVPFGTTSTPVSWQEPTSSDNSGTSIQSPSIPSGTDFPVGTTPVTYTFTDPTGNTVTQSFNVNVIMLSDTQPPEVTIFPQDITVTVPFGTTSTPVNWPTPIVTDNSGTVDVSTNRQPGSSFAPGTSPVTYTFTDPAGNVVTRSFRVNVVVLPDSTRPVITSFPSDITVTVPFGSTSAPVSWDEPTSSDNSGISLQSPTRPSGSDFPIGTTPVTYTFTDPTGNSVTQTFNVNVIMLPDTEPPQVVTFPQDITVTVPFGTVSTPVTWQAPVITDNSGTVDTQADRQPGSFFPPGTSPVTYTFSDPAGNEVTQSFDVTVLVLPDSSSPVVISFPSDITVTVPFGTSSTPVTWTEPTSTDNSGTSIQSPSIPSGSDFPVGTTPVTYTFTDPTGNSVTQSFDVNVIMLPDNETPQIMNFPQDITVTVPFGTTSTPVNWQPPTVSDNSGMVETSRSREPGSSFLPGTTPVVYTFTDGSGNEVSRSFSVNVIVLPDDTTPVITSFPSDITVTVPFGVTSSLVSWEEPTSTDNSGISFQNPSRASGSEFPVGTTQVTYDFTDPTGNTVTQSFNVNVIMLTDTETPQINSFPQDITVTVPYGTTSTPVSWQQPLVSDNSGTVSTTTNREPGSSFPPGATPVTYTFTDPAGNFVSDTFTVNVVVLPDSTPPSISSFPSDITVTVPFGTSSTQVTWEEPTSTDNSGTSIQNPSKPSGSTFNIGTTPVTYSFTDPTGNSVTRSFNVNVIMLGDVSRPVVTSFPSDITVNVPFGSTGTPVTWADPTAEDNSGTVTITPTIPSGTTFPVGTTPVTYTFVDPSGNTVSQTFNVNVNMLPDTEPPQVTSFPDDVTVTVPFGTTMTPVTWAFPSAIDNSGSSNINSDRQPGSLFPVGNTPVTYKFTDPSGNEVEQTFNVNVVELPDNTPPVINTFPSDITVTVPYGTTSTPVTWQEPTSTDDSGSSLPSPSRASGSDFPVGTTPVTYTFTDPTGNTVTQTFNVNVVQLPDAEVPQVTSFPEDITFTVPFGTTNTPVTWDDPTATDNSGSVTSNPNRQPGSSFPPGTTPVTYTFADPSGNFVTRTFNVNVVVLPDNTPPVVNTFPSDITVTVPFGTTSTPVTWEEPSSTDDSGTSFQNPSRLPGSSFPVGTTPVTYDFTDPSGNTVTQTFDVNVVELPDTVMPSVINTPQNIEVLVPFGSTGTNVNWTPPVATDNSGSVISSTTQEPGSFFPTGTSTPVVYTFTDPAGNEATTTFTVTVTELPDDVPPMITSTSEDITVTVPFQSPGTTVTWTEPTATDNSGSATTSKTHEPGSFFPTGSVTPVTYRFTDPAGNTVSTTFTVRVIPEEDDVSPVLITCQKDITFTVLTGMAPVPVTFTAPTASDNSGRVNLVLFTKSPGDLFNVGRTTVEYLFQDQAGNTASCTFEVNIVEANPCLPEPCLNGAACVPTTLTTYQCLCPDCFSGDNCETAVDACEGNLCQNGAACSALLDSCTQYECQCPACYTGQFCQTLVDSCDNHQCANGAVCVASATNCIEYSCQCPPCFTGRYCDIPTNACDNNGCQNGGVCVPSSLSPNSAFACSEYTCSCSGCYTGPRCQLERQACNPNPCLNNGVCTELPDSCYSYTCQCTGCFTGFNCELAIPSPCDNNPCQNGGVCSVVQGTCGAYTCTCPNAFIGLNCDISVSVNPNPCNSFPCKNGASCQTMDGSYYICLCTVDYVGPNCLTPKANAPQLNPCADSQCINGAQCFNSFNSNSGTNTAIPQYTCVCADGFTGANCATPTGSAPELDVCNLGVKHQCHQGAQCYNTYHSLDQDVDYYCDCPVGFIGHNCDTSTVNPCNSNPCKNGANCIPFNTFFMCECGIGFGGKSCEDRVGDTTAPVIQNCPESMYIAVGGQTSQIVTWTPPTATDNSNTAALVYVSHQPDTTFGLGVTPITYVFADPSQNYAQCTFFITIEDTSPVDTSPPTIINCPSDISLLAAPGAPSAVATWVEPTATDNSGSAVSRQFSAQSGSLFNIGVTPVTYTFTDGSGNRAVCTFTVTVTGQAAPDTTPPVISGCPPSASAVAAQGAASAQVFWVAPSATDDSGNAVTVETTHQPGQSFAIGSTPVTYTFTDSSGNPSICTFSVVVTAGADSTPPQISDCPMGASATAETGSSVAQVIWQTPTALDSSGGQVSVQASHQPGQNFPIGVTTVTYIFTDASGNEATCSFVVMVNNNEMPDTIAPVISGCPTTKRVNPDQGANFATVSWIEPTAVDNSGEVPGVAKSHTPPAIFQINTITRVSYVFYDTSGNFDTCAFTVEVTNEAVGGDNTNPVFTDCPDSVVSYVNGPDATASVGWSVPSAIDNSGIPPTVTGSLIPPVDMGVGSTTASYTATDAAGNQATCTFPVSVILDNVAPSFTDCPLSRALTLPDGSSSVASTWVEPVASDNSGTVSVVQNYSPGDQFQLGNTTVTYTATDGVGNQNTCSFAVSVSTSSGVVQNPCSSNPCPSNQVCYYRPQPAEFICLASVMKRDAEEDDCLCKNGGICIDHYESKSCLCPRNFTGILCEEKPVLMDLNKYFRAQDVDTYVQHVNDHTTWMMVGMICLLGLVILALVITITRLAARTSVNRSDNIDKASLVY